jgi:hypothetical protein
MSKATRQKYYARQRQYAQGNQPFFLEIPKAVIKVESEKAKLLDDGNLKIWIPKSQILFENEDSGIVSMTLPMWFIEKNEALTEYIDQRWDEAGRPD